MTGFSEETLDHFQSPRNVGVLKNPDGVGTAGKPGEGHFMVFYVRVRGETLTEVSFQTFGCPAAIACGSLLTEQAKGRSIEEAMGISEREILDGLGGLPLGKRKNAGMALAALHGAIDDCRRKRGSGKEQCP